MKINPFLHLDPYSSTTSSAIRAESRVSSLSWKRFANHQSTSFNLRERTLVIILYNSLLTKIFISHLEVLSINLYTFLTVFFLVVKTGYLDIWEPATLTIKRDGYSIKCSGPSGVVVTEKFSSPTIVCISIYLAFISYNIFCPFKRKGKKREGVILKNIFSCVCKNLVDYGYIY